MNDRGTDDGVCGSSWFCTSGSVNAGSWKFTGSRTDGGTSTGIGAGASAGVVGAGVRLVESGAHSQLSGGEIFCLFRAFLEAF
jgi:hypothetical protein